MKISTKDTTKHLQGDLTCSGVSQRSIDALAFSLRRLESEGKKNIRIDCGRIRRADISGLRLLYVWIQCAKFTGLELELVNLSRSLQKVMRQSGLGYCFSIDKSLMCI